MERKCISEIFVTGVSGLHHIRLKSLLTYMADIDLNNTKIRRNIFICIWILVCEFSDTKKY